jgi:hypothetical protein
MRLLEFLAQAFIATFGITEPAPEQRRTVSLLLGGLILTVSVTAVVAMGFLVFSIHHGR